MSKRRVPHAHPNVRALPPFSPTGFLYGDAMRAALAIKNEPQASVKIEGVDDETRPAPPKPLQQVQQPQPHRPEREPHASARGGRPTAPPAASTNAGPRGAQRARKWPAPPYRPLLVPALAALAALAVAALAALAIYLYPTLREAVALESDLQMPQRVVQASNEHYSAARSDFLQAKGTVAGIEPGAASRSNLLPHFRETSYDAAESKRSPERSVLQTMGRLAAAVHAAKADTKSTKGLARAAARANSSVSAACSIAGRRAASLETITSSVTAEQRSIEAEREGLRAKKKKTMHELQFGETPLRTRDEELSRQSEALKSVAAALRSAKTHERKYAERCSALLGDLRGITGILVDGADGGDLSLLPRRHAQLVANWLRANATSTRDLDAWLRNRK